MRIVTARLLGSLYNCSSPAGMRTCEHIGGWHSGEDGGAHKGVGGGVHREGAFGCSEVCDMCSRAGGGQSSEV